MSISDRDARRRWQYAGLDCAMIDSGIGFINGYVRLPQGHFARGVSHDALNRAVSVHGGLTYGSDEDGWVGFDTGHSGDYWPGITDERLLCGPVERTWDLERLAGEIESLAEQLAVLTSLPLPESSWEFRTILRQAKAWRRLRAARDGAS